MLIIEHRVNARRQLRQVPPDRGVEIDVREQSGELVLAHDPCESGEPLIEFLADYRHAMLVINVKCDGLESLIRPLLDRQRITEYFFLDVALPSLVRLVESGEDRVAVRFSEHEPIELALALAGRARWVWVDCFSRLPLDADSHSRLAEHFRICLVSPELQRHSRRQIDTFKHCLQGLPIDAVCTDLPDAWT